MPLNLCCSFDAKIYVDGQAGFSNPTINPFYPTGWIVSVELQSNSCPLVTGRRSTFEIEPDEICSACERNCGVVSGLVARKPREEHATLYPNLLHRLAEDRK
ncbi:MAG: hypothetical protein JW395_4121 [Nitrospira sp.]|nr:hypothetical protein [Nitrospira sp.]